MNEHLSANPISELAAVSILPAAGIPVLAPGVEGDERRPEAIIFVPGAGSVKGKPKEPYWTMLCALVAEVEL